MLRCFSTGSAGRTGSRTGSPSRASPTATGKVERFHQTLERELLGGWGAFESIEAAQAALDAWVQEYHSVRPHQALDMQSPADRFTPVPEQERGGLEVRLPGMLALVPQQRTAPFPDYGAVSGVRNGPGVSSWRDADE